MRETVPPEVYAPTGMKLEMSGTTLIVKVFVVTAEISKVRSLMFVIPPTPESFTQSPTAKPCPAEVTTAPAIAVTGLEA